MKTTSSFRGLAICAVLLAGLSPSIKRGRGSTSGSLIAPVGLDETVDYTSNRFGSTLFLGKPIRDCSACRSVDNCLPFTHCNR